MRAIFSVIVLQWCSIGYACSPYEWSHGGGAKSSSEYAQLLLQKASAIVLARVTLTAMVPLHRSEHSQIAMSTVEIRGYAQIEMLERFKGPENLRIIYTAVRMGNCGSPAFVDGEERLFVLNLSRDDKYFEVIAWQTPQFPQRELIEHMRVLSQSNSHSSGTREKPRALQLER